MYLNFATVDAGKAFGDFMLSRPSKLSTLPTVEQRLKGCEKIAQTSQRHKWDAVTAFVDQLKACKESDSKRPEYLLSMLEYDPILDFLAGFALKELTCHITFGQLLVALCLRDFELKCMPATTIRKMYDDPWYVAGLAKIHTDLHQHFMVESPRSTSKSDLYAWKATAFPSFNTILSYAKAPACPLHAPGAKCDITFV